MKVILFLCLVSAAFAGLHDHNKNTRIVDGEEAGLNEFPWQVSIRLVGHVCGGVIIGSRWVLTSASCVAGLSEKIATIRYGTNVHNQDGFIVAIDNIIIHTDFDRTNMVNDIALIKTKEEMDCAVYLKAAPLPEIGQKVYTGTPLQVTGWGFHTTETGDLSGDLQKAEISVIRDNDCVLAYGKHNITIQPRAMVCAGDLKNGGPSICQGDQGGPASWEEEDNLVVGISSFSLGCGSPGIPSVFTRVSFYRSWIQKETGI